MPRVGGCTFPEDPAHSCAHVLPVWSAGVDPRVIPVELPPDREGSSQWRLDLRRHRARVVTGTAGDHVRIDEAGHVIRLDMLDDMLARRSMALRVVLEVGPNLPLQAEAAHTLRRLVSGALRPNIFHERQAGALLGLWALDARRAGASLRDIADLLLGPGDWPGDGEYRKSRARRLVAAGDAMIRGGPGAILR
ncbi:DNA -binding domain-containing protein [Sphingobium sp. MI1205]|uniref:DNA -binding domain-containing protein n=1 Tax=Sphingobium sp. MI1205 TaxID=407020 RepID=UPI00076FF541|nr:DUF2285 domain-containing protein [Sphingobium sp. MI1205]AMK18903.1 hypothetical protein K663_12615 [Sphingobium sp. MI1205]